jgi:hypothetical protein
MQLLANLPDIDSDLETTDTLTKDMLVGSLPDKRFRKYVTDDLVAVVNSEPDSEIRRVYRDNILTYSTVLSAGKYSLSAYINAVKFVSLKMLGDKSSTAYSKVFPDRYQNLITKGTSASQIACFADNYGKNSLVIKIMEQSIIPTHILNAGIYQKAINVQADLMYNARSELVQQKAAESLMTQLKPPETSKVEIDINYSNDMVEELRRTTRALAKQQLQMIVGGQASAKEIAHSEIVARKAEPIETEYNVE